MGQGVSAAMRKDIPAEVLDGAIQWMVRLHSGTADDGLRASLAAWRAADPVHERAWQELNDAERPFRAIPRQPRGAAFHALSTIGSSRPVNAGRRSALKMIGIGVSVGAAGYVAGRQVPWHAMTAEYATGAGERRGQDLADGTRLQLNTRTAVDVAFTAADRRILLHQGEIFVTTAGDAGGRAFWVETAQARLQALGTRFNLRCEDGITRLHVAAGEVAIHPHRAAGVMLARAGSAYVVAPTGVAPAPDNGLDPTGWTDGALVAKRMRLGDFLAELSRYRPGWLRCDPAAADLLVSGVFQLADTDRVLEAVTQALPVRIARHTRYWVTIVPA